MSSLAIKGGPLVRKKEYPSWPVFGEHEKEYLFKVLESRKWGRTSGGMNDLFEEKYSRFQEAKHTITVCNGTIALRIALFAAGVGPGDEVIVPSYTFVATATAVIESNAVPVFADIDYNTFNILPESIEKLITKKTKAIIPVHFGGAPADMAQIMKIAKRHKLAVIEDAAQAQGSSLNGKRVGTIGDIGTFSFQLSKNMTSGEGGAIITNNDQLAARARAFHNCGRKPDGLWYAHYGISGNYRLSEFQAAVLLAQLEREEANLKLRTDNAEYLDKLLSGFDGVEPITYPKAAKSSYYLYVAKYQSEKFSNLPKSKFIEALNAEGIPAIIGYPFPLYKQPIFIEKNFWNRLPN
jgi:dTDP-4-amino-4,6-dideoxygalactose transaminase